VNLRIAWLFAGALLATGTCVHAGDRTASGSSVTGILEGPPRPVWVGEAFDLTLTWRAPWSAFRNLEGPLQWSAGPLIADAWDKPTLTELRSPSGEDLAAASIHMRALVLQPGSIALNPAQQTVIVENGTVTTGDYERSLTKSITARSNAAALQVRALPTPPAGYSGAIGHFTLTASADPARPRVGQTVVWSLVLTGVGNWPYLEGFPVRQVSRDFEVVGTPQVNDAPGATLFERSMRETVALIPRRAGRYALGPVYMLVFDPDRGEYSRIGAPSITLDVSPNGAAPSEAGPEISGAPTPLLGKGKTIAPMSPGWWQAARLIPLVVVAGAWMLLACLRVLQRDPTREARRAYARMHCTLPAIASTTDASRRRTLVRLWQRDSAVLCKLSGAAPIPASFGHPAWQQLWAESEVFLYGKSAHLPADWVPRADRLLPSVRPPFAFSVRARIRTANLPPLICALFLIPMVCAKSVPAAEPRDRAEHRESSPADPLDWKARYDAALNMAARGRWDEAAGQAGIAWIQHPNMRSTQKLWLKASSEAGYASADDGGAPLPVGFWGSIASAASPSVWRWVLLAAENIAAVAAVLFLLAGYGHARKCSARRAAALFAGAAISVLAASMALQVYGILAEPDAVLIWHTSALRTEPVESPPDRAPRPAALTAGTVGRVDRRFLDWRRVTLADGRAGWLRQGDLLWIWGANN
jgi:hypothetical protein